MTNEEAAEINKKLFDYLYLKESPKKAAIIIGFGHFDLKIPAKCAALYQKGWAKKIILTGGVGAGSADLNIPEADSFNNFLRTNTQISADDITIENKSTNTGENLRFTLQIVKEKDTKLYKELTSGKVILVANPFRQRRVFLTAAKILPQAQLINCPPESDYDTEKSLFNTKGENLDQQLPSEVLRIIKYPDNSWIKREPLPEDIRKLIAKKQ